MSRNDLCAGSGRRARLLSGLAALLALGLVVGVSAWLRIEDPVLQMERLIEAWGLFAVLASIGLMVAHSFVSFPAVSFPAEMLAIVNGILFGPIWGTIITWTGAMLGAYLAFGWTRALGRSFVKGMVPGLHWKAIES